MARKLPPETGMISWAFVICALVAAMLWGCAPKEATQPKAPDRQRVIVKFRIPEEPGKSPAHDTTARILSRLEPQVRKTARTFQLLPLIAVEADADTLMRLIRMPEVESITPDREVKTLIPSGTPAR